MYNTKAISEFDLLGLAYQIKYLMSKKDMSDEEIASYIKEYLSDKGIPVEKCNTPIAKR